MTHQRMARWMLAFGALGLLAFDVGARSWRHHEQAMTMVTNSILIGPGAARNLQSGDHVVVIGDCAAPHLIEGSHVIVEGDGADVPALGEGVVLRDFINYNNRWCHWHGVTVACPPRVPVNCPETWPEL